MSFALVGCVLSGKMLYWSYQFHEGSIGMDTLGAFEKFKPVETKRASEAIYEQVRELINSGELKPGERLPSERNMLELFQRSRPTIREALRMLERAGYIRTVPGSSGAIVMPPNDKNLENSLADALSIGHISLEALAEFRVSTEMSAAAWAAQRRTQEDIAALEALVTEMKACQEDFEQAMALDSRFHGVIAQAAKNAICVIVHNTFSKLNRSFFAQKMESVTAKRQKKMIQRICQMHEAIFDAIKAGDAEAASAAMKAHLDAFKDDLK